MPSRSLRASLSAVMLALLPASCARPGTRATPAPGVSAPARAPLHAVRRCAPARAVEPGTPGAAAAPARPARPEAWARRFGGPEGDEAAAVAVDGQGSVYLVGQITGAVPFDDIVLESAGSSDIFVAKLSPAGAVEWARTIGGSEHDFGTAIGVTADGEVVILGVFAGDVQVGGQILRARGSQDTLLAALSPDGEPLWGRRLSSPDWDVGMALALDANGDIVVAGAFSGTLDLGFATEGKTAGALASAGEADAFMARFDAAGALLWARRLGGEGWDEAAGVALDRGGRAVVVGAWSGDRGTSAFVAVHDREGREIWSQRIGERGTVAQGVAIGPAREILVAGSFQGRVSLGGPPLASAGRQDLFVASYDRAGEHIWSRGFGGAADDCARAILITPGGGFAIAGAFSGDVPLDGAPTGQHRDIFFAGYDAAGALRWSVGVSAPGAGTRAIAAAPDGRLLAAGSFLDSMRVGGVALDSAGSFDAFVVALSPSWTYKNLGKD